MRQRHEDDDETDETTELRNLLPDEISFVDVPCVQPWKRQGYKGNFIVIKSAGGREEDDMPDGLTLTEEQVAEIEAGLNTPVRREDAIVAKAERRKGADLAPDDEAKLRGVLRLLRGSDPAVLDALRDRLEGADEGADDRDATAKCRKCGTAVKADSKFCHKCGGRVGKADDEPGADGPTPGASRCGKCGRKVTMAEAYCTRCGAAQTGSGNDFREKFRKAADRPRALAERAKRFDEETLENLALALGELSVHITDGHPPIEVAGPNMGVDALEGAAKEVFDAAEDLDADDLEELISYIRELRATQGNLRADNLADLKERVGVDSAVAKAATTAYGEMERLAREMISQGVRKADGQSMTLADAMLQVGADHPALYEAYVEGQQAGAFVATPKQPVRKTVAPWHAYLVAVESRISKADLKNYDKYFVVAEAVAKESPELYADYCRVVTN